MEIRQRLLYYNLQKMLECRDTLRCDPPDNYTYHDRLFANRINHLIQLTDTSYRGTIYREALKNGFYGLQVSSRSLEKLILYAAQLCWMFKGYHRSNATK